MKFTRSPGAGWNPYVCGEYAIKKTCRSRFGDYWTAWHAGVRIAQSTHLKHAKAFCEDHAAKQATPLRELLCTQVTVEQAAMLLA
jgi:hypothetical protein